MATSESTPRRTTSTLTTAPETRAARIRREPRPGVFGIVVTLTLFLTDMIAIATGYWVAFSVHDVPVIDVTMAPTPQSTIVWLAALTSGIVAVWFVVSGLYVGRRGVSRMDDATRVAMRVLLAALLSLGVASLLLGGEFTYSRPSALAAAGLSVGLVIAGRFVHTGIVGRLRARGIGADRVLIVGAGPTGELVLDKIRRSPQLGLDVAGFVRHRPWPAGRARSEIDDVPVLGLSDELSEIVERHQIDEIIIALSGVAHEEILDIVFRVTENPVAIRVYPDTFRLLTSDVLSISDLNGLPTVRVRTIGLRPLERAIKRVMDVLISTIVLVMLAPFMLIIALLVKLSSPGPVFYVQERVSQDGRPILVLKFRSMPVDAEAETGPVFARPDDQRPTRLGRFMRRYSIDELPQFINVLLGDMSIVGPRPERPYFVEQFRQTIPAYMARHHEKAGITGWAQVNGLRGDTSIEERTRYDLYYVENWSIFFDLKIMLKTLLHIFRRDSNAY